MKNSTKEVFTMLLAFGLLAAPISQVQPQRTQSNQQNLQNQAVQQSQQNQPKPPADISAEDETKRLTEERIENRDRARKGISVELPKVYDDALLQQMLDAAEARLSTIQLFDQASIAARLGAVTGASQQISSVGFNVQGAPLPGITTVSKGATGSTTQTTAAGATSSGFTVVSGLPSQDVTTTMPSVNPPPVTAPAPTTSLPSSFNVSASDILNEQAQLTAEISSLRLLIRGALSDHFVNAESSGTKKKLTLGFPITLNPDERYKDAVAVVEVEVGPDLTEIQKVAKESVEEEIKEGKTFPDQTTEIANRVSRQLAVDPPSIATLLPREKTYNVAAISDKSLSLGGGIATQILGFSGSWLRGHKTYYLVQDQDTVALSFRPLEPNKLGFMWEFRPVLGRQYVSSGLKQTFVQLAFVGLEDAAKLGTVTVRTYWRKYDRKRGITRGIIPDSLAEEFRDEKIYTYRLSRPLQTFNSRDHIEDVGGGQVMVKLIGRYLPGTYVRIGSTLLLPGPQLTYEHEGLRFVASASDLATKAVALVAHDGTEVPLQLKAATCSQQKIVITGKSIEPFDDTSSKLTLTINEDKPEDLRPTRVVVIGARVFGYSDAPIVRSGNTLSIIVPNSLLNTRPKMRVQTLLPVEKCVSDSEDAPKPIPTERLVVLERTEKQTKFLLTGKNLTNISVLSPANVLVQQIGNPSDPDTLVTLTLTAEQLKTNKQLLLQRPTEAPFLISIPDLDAKKPEAPKARERVTTDSDELVIDGDGMKDLVKVSWNKLDVPSFDVANDGKSVHLAGLRKLGATSVAGSQSVVLEFKSGAKATVTFEIVNAKIETIPK